MKIDDENDREREREREGEAFCPGRSVCARAPAAKMFERPSVFQVFREACRKSIDRPHLECISYITYRVIKYSWEIFEWPILNVRNDYYKVGIIKISVEAYSPSYRLLKFAPSEVRCGQERDGCGK